MKVVEQPTNKARRTVDQLGEIKAMIADLEAKEAELRQRMIDLGIDAVEGYRFRCTVSTHDHTDTDWRAIVEALPPTRQIKRLTKKYQHTEPRTTVRVSSR